MELYYETLLSGKTIPQKIHTPENSYHRKSMPQKMRLVHAQSGKWAQFQARPRPVREMGTIPGLATAAALSWAGRAIVPFVSPTGNGPHGPGRWDALNPDNGPADRPTD